MMPAGSVNAWKCDTCGRLLVAIHVDGGVTPMFLSCRETPNCRGQMVSSGYPPAPIPERVMQRLAWEWAKPSTTQLKAWKRDRHPMYHHVSLGGLVLRELSDAGRAVVSGGTS